MKVKFLKNGTVVDTFHLNDDTNLIEGIQNDEYDVVFTYGIGEIIHSIDVTVKKFDKRVVYWFDDMARLCKVSRMGDGIERTYCYDVDRVGIHIDEPTQQSLLEYRIYDQKNGTTVVIMDDCYTVLNKDAVIGIDDEISADTLAEIKSGDLMGNFVTDGCQFYNFIMHRIDDRSCWPILNITYHVRNSRYQCIHAMSNLMRANCLYMLREDINSYYADVTIRTPNKKSVTIGIPYISTTPNLYLGKFYDDNNMLNMINQYFGRIYDADDIIIE